MYEPGTGVAYAEIIGNSVVCLETGLELRRIGQHDDDMACPAPCPFQKRFDFKPPGGARHPEDKTVDVAALVRFGILSEDAVQSRRPFTREVSACLWTGVCILTIHGRSWMHSWSSWLGERGPCENAGRLRLSVGKRDAQPCLHQPCEPSSERLAVYYTEILNEIP